MNSEYKILLVDDEPDILEFLSYNLRKENYFVLTSSNGKEAISIAGKEIPQLIVLDVMMPEMNGMEVCRELRKNQKLKDTLIAFLTARNEDYSQISGFDSGADDYITKPIKPSVFISRVKALLRRAASSSVDEIGGIKIDREKYLVGKNGKEFSLPKKEFELLALLTSKPGRVFRREEILERVWGNEVVVGDRTIDVHIRKLREKLGEEYFQTVKGVGYKFEF
ncbi:MAG: response regulator transcription factor [Bacteroidetes bacterium]|nr:response regulator transcription factor [Bacteroidota bacterium]